MRDQSAGPFEELPIFVAECVEFLTFGVEHSDNVTMSVGHRDDDFGARGVKRWQITRILVHVTDHNRLARFERRAAESLGNWKSRIRWRLIAGAGQDHEFLLHYLVNADPSIISGRPDHLGDIFQSFRRAAAGQNKRADLLQGLARLGFHSGNQSGVEN
jgi:hypothetical protein